MKRRALVVRAAVLLCSAGLVAGYVGYKAWARGDGGTPRVKPGSESAPPEDFFSGTKSGEIFDEPPVQPEAFIGGTKSARIVEPDEVVPAAPETKPAQVPEPKPAPKKPD